MKHRNHDQTVVNPGLAIRRSEETHGSSFRRALQTGMALILLYAGISLTNYEEPKSGRATLASAQTETDDVYSPLTLQSINAHMQFTERKAELNSLATEMENEALSSPALPEPLVLTHPRLENTFETEDRAGKVYRDIHPNDGRYDTPILPTDRINSIVEQDKWMRKFDDVQKRAFIEAFKANARADGLEVEINDRLEVVRVQRIPTAARDPQSSSNPHPQ